MFRFRPSCPNWNETAPYADVQPNHVGRTVWLKQATDPRRVRPILRTMKKNGICCNLLLPKAFVHMASGFDSQGRPGHI